MNKKIFIASLFAILMLLVPMTSVAGISDVSLNREIEKIEDNNTITETYDDEDCGCEVVNRYDLLRVRYLLIRIKRFTNLLLLRFEHIPEVAEKCYKILDIINSNRQPDYPVLCAILEPIYNSLVNIYNFFKDLAILYEDYWWGEIFWVPCDRMLVGLAIATDLLNGMGCDILPWEP